MACAVVNLCQHKIKAALAVVLVALLVLDGHGGRGRGGLMGQCFTRELTNAL